MGKGRGGDGEGEGKGWGRDGEGMGKESGGRVEGGGGKEGGRVKGGRERGERMMGSREHAECNECRVCYSKHW